MLTRTSSLMKLLALEWLLGVGMPDKLKEASLAIKALYDEDIADEVCSGWDEPVILPRCSLYTSRLRIRHFLCSKFGKYLQQQAGHSRTATLTYLCEILDVLVSRTAPSSTFSTQR